MDLKELLGEELYNQVMEKAGDKHKIAVVSDGNWFPKSKFDEVNEAKKKLESDIADRDKQLEELSKAAGTSEELKKQIEQLQADNKAAKEKYEAEMNEMRTNAALKQNLFGKVHDPDLVIGLLNKETLKIDENGTVTGLEEQLKSLKEKKGFLFVPENGDKPAFSGFRPFDTDSNGDKGGDSNNFGKILASYNKKASSDMSKAQANYFGGAKDE